MARTNGQKNAVILSGGCDFWCNTPCTGPDDCRCAAHLAAHFLTGSVSWLCLSESSEG
jgi:hypothetical protein